MEPITRSEQYLASIIGEDVVLPVPQSRIEHYLNLIAQNGISPSSAGLISYDPDADYPDGSLGAGMKAEAAEVNDLKSQIENLDGLSPALKAALLQLAEKVAYIDANGATYYQALYDALYPAAGLDSITCVYTQSGTVYTTDTLDSLKNDLVVTAHWDDNTSTTVASADYTLSGTLTAGTSTITVAYGGKTTTFTVTVSHADNSIINWDFTQSLVDSKQGLTATLGGNATQDSSGLHINSASDYATFGTILANNQSYEIDIASMDVTSWTSGNGRLFIWKNSNGSGLVYHSTGTWACYKGSWVDFSPTISDKKYFENCTLKIKVEDGATQYAKKVTVYKDGVEVFSNDSMANDPISSTAEVYLGSNSSACHNMTITGFRVYSEV